MNIVKNLKVSDFEFIKDIESKVDEGDNLYEQGRSKTLDILEFIKRENISYSEIVEWIKEKFVEKNCIITNSEDNTAKTLKKQLKNKKNY